MKRVLAWAVGFAEGVDDEAERVTNWNIGELG